MKTNRLVDIDPINTQIRNHITNRGFSLIPGTSSTSTYRMLSLIRKNYKETGIRFVLRKS